MWQGAAAQEADTVWTRQTLGEDILDVKFSPDGTVIATAHKDPETKGKAVVRIWNVSNGDIIKILQTSSDLVNSISFTNDGLYLYVACGYFLKPPTLSKWDLNRNEKIKEYDINLTKWDKISNIYLSENNSKIILGLHNLDSSYILALDNESGSIINQIPLNSSLGKLIVSSEENYFATLTQKYINGWIKQVTLWDAVTYQKIKTLEDTKEAIEDIDFSSDGKVLFAIQGYKNKLKSWSIPEGVLIKDVNPIQSLYLFQIAPFISENILFISFRILNNLSGNFGIYNLKSDTFNYIYNYISTKSTSISVSPNEAKIASISSDKIDLLNNHPASNIKVNNLEKTISFDTVIPNPSTHSALINIYLKYSGIFNFILVNEAGLELKILYKGYLDAGLNNIMVDLSDLPSGNYFVTITGVNYTKTLKLIILK